jgi:phosphonate transport system substrate-binding protein
MRWKNLLLFVCAVIPLLNLLTLTRGLAQPITTTISLGVVSERPRERIQEHRDFVNYLAQKMSSSSEVKGKVVVTRTASELASLLDGKQVVFYMESAYPTFRINEQTGAKLILRRWKGGVGEYRSLFLSRRDGGISRLKELRGKMIAFEDPDSTTGYFLPKALLVKKGFKLTEKSSFDADISPKEIGYLFGHGSERNIISWVILRKVAAAAFSNNDFDALHWPKKKELIVLAETETLPRHLLSVRKDLDPAFVRRLKNILLSMHENEEGQKVLKRLDRTTKFDLLPGGEEVMYQKIRQLWRLTTEK